MIPQLIFKYSSVYDFHYKEFFQLLFPDKDIHYPDREEILTIKTSLKREWKLAGNEILNAVSKVSNLEWKTKSIDVFLVGKARPISSPLTLPIAIKGVRNYSGEVMFDILVHELIHVILVDNKWNSLTDFNKEFAEENNLVKVHILVHAIHKEVYLKLFNEKRLAADVKRSENYSDYKRSWDIVNELGAKGIIDKLE